MSSANRPQVGIGLLVVKGNQVLLGKRKGSHGAGEYAGMGGHMEHNESLEQTALRELAEECGTDIKVKNLRFLCVGNIKDYLPKHYIDIGFVADWKSGQPKVMEPHKLESWNWYSLDKLPQPLFAVEKLYIEAYTKGKQFFDA